MISQRISILLREKELLEKNRKRFENQKLNQETKDISNNNIDKIEIPKVKEEKSEIGKDVNTVKDNEEEIFL